MSLPGNSRLARASVAAALTICFAMTATWTATCLAQAPAPAGDHEHSQAPAPPGGETDATNLPRELGRILLLRDYNTRIVLIGTTLLGVCTGVIGVFMLLRKRSLMSDVVSHSSLPGIGVAYVTMEIVWPGEGKWVPGLLVGAAAAGLCGMVCTVAIRRWTRVKEDAALAIVLSIFFGWGVVMFTVIQKLPTGNAAGINHFIFGKAASMIASDVRLIGVGSAIILAVALALFKELRLLCFDERFARTQGWPAMRLDMLLMGLVVAVTVIGLQSVGLLLVVAMLIIPAAAARFWSDHLSRLTAIAASIGGASAIIGVVLSALFPRLAAGAVIVLSGTVLFLVSMFFGSRRGVVRRLIAFRRLQLRTEHQHVLRAIFEHLEQASEKPSIAVAFSIDDLIPLRSWSRRDVQRQARRLQRDGLLAGHELEWRLTAAGLRRSEQVVRNHRLWELYLIQYADIAPSHVDRDADQIEHLLEPNLIAELELLLAPSGAVPSSPHALGEEGI